MLSNMWIFRIGLVVSIALLIYYMYEEPDYSMNDFAQIIGLVLVCYHYGWNKAQLSGSSQA